MSAAIVQKIVSEQSLTTLRDFLKKSTPESLASVTNGDPLDQLNPGIKSLGYLFILYVISFSRCVIVSNLSLGKPDFNTQHPLIVVQVWRRRLLSSSKNSMYSKSNLFRRNVLHTLMLLSLISRVVHDLVTIFTSLCDLELRAVYSR